MVDTGNGGCFYTGSAKQRTPDEEHPFGHGRSSISGLSLAISIFGIGGAFLYMKAFIIFPTGADGPACMELRGAQGLHGLRSNLMAFWLESTQKRKGQNECLANRS